MFLSRVISAKHLLTVSYTIYHIPFKSDIDNATSATYHLFFVNLNSFHCEMSENNVKNKQKLHYDAHAIKMSLRNDHNYNRIYKYEHVPPTNKPCCVGLSGLL